MEYFDSEKNKEFTEHLSAIEKRADIESGMKRISLELADIIGRQRGKWDIVLGTEKQNGKPFTFSLEQRRLHSLILGKSGVGKTTLIQRIILSDIYAGQGVCIVDVHGDIIDSLLKKIPKKRAKEVLLFDPSQKNTLVLNVLEAKTTREKLFIMEELISLLYSFYDPNRSGIVGPQFEQATRYAVLTIMHSTIPGTLADVPSIIASEEIRNHYLSAISNKQEKQHLLKFWNNEWEKKTQFHLSEILCYVTSKFEQFRSNKIIKKVLCANSSTLNIREAMDTGKILLFKIHKGYLGDACARFLDSFLISKIFAEALGRTDLSPEARKDFFLYLDEFSNFSLDNIKMLIAEARKYKIHITLATQSLMSLKYDICESILGNVSNMMLFRTGYSDAIRLVPHLMPYFKDSDLIALPNYQAIVKTAEIEGITYPTIIKTQLDYIF